MHRSVPAMHGARFSSGGGGAKIGEGKACIGSRFTLGGAGGAHAGFVRSGIQPRFVLGGEAGEAAARRPDAASEDSPTAYRIQVVPVKNKSVSFYVSLAKRALLVNETLELVGVGSAMATTVNVSEVLHNSGAAARVKVCTSTVAVPPAPPEADGFGCLSLGSQPGKLSSRPMIQIWMNTGQDLNHASRRTQAGCRPLSSRE